METQKESRLAFFAAVFLHFIAITAHFYLCIAFIHLIGDPLRVPNWLHDINIVLLYKPLSFARFCFSLLWIILMVLFYLLLRLIAMLTARLLSGNFNSGQNKATVIRAFKISLPFLLVSLFTLAIIPMRSHNTFSGASEMTYGTALTFDQFLSFMSEGTFAMLLVLCMLLFPFLIFALICILRGDKYEAGIGLLIGSIFISIALVLIMAFTCGPFIDHLFTRFGGKIGFLILFGIYALLSGVGMSIHGTKEKLKEEKVGKK
jgi:hypothetical protein